MTTVAYRTVAKEGRADRHQIHRTDEAMPGLRFLTDAVHAEGAAVAAQIGHGGPVADARANGAPVLSPSRRFHAPTLGWARRASIADIRRITEAHAEAARRAGGGLRRRRGPPGPHNYLASSFLSPRINRRTDTYGGTLANRTRFACASTATSACRPTSPAPAACWSPPAPPASTPGGSPPDTWADG
ncbi:hypothetical protein ACFXPV_25310 [Streptomyces sp. NPDC059118]|uniref:oxidoreductase n=1 Tax=unclassified Streptomyces TaxID=2593676 RepID=UPI003694426B